MTAADPTSPPTETAAPTRNPYRLALLVAAVTLTAIGAVVWVAGTASIGASSAFPGSGSRAALGAQAAGGALLGIGVIGLFLWLAVAAILWRRPAR